MKIPGWIVRMFTVDDGVMDEQFSLVGMPHEDEQNDEGSAPDVERDHEDGDTPVRQDADTGERTESHVIRPIPMGELLRNSQSGVDRHPARSDELPISHDLDEVKRTLEAIFHLPDNKDIYIREFHVGVEHAWRALAVFVDGMADKTIINNFILEPLMLLSRMLDEAPPRRMKIVSNTLLPGNQAVEEGKWEAITAGILAGSTAVFVEGCDTALVVETKGWEHRTVGLTQTESVVRGPHDAFTESFRANTALVRSRLRAKDLVTEMLSVGNLGKTDVAVMHVKGLTNPRLVQEVKRRILAIDVDYLADSGELQQYIEDNPYTMVPQVFATERPDRIAHMLTEGHVAIFVGNSPYVLATPVVFWMLVQSPEDAYLRYPFGSFLRLIRWIAVFIALLLPSMYVSITNYHPEMIPTDLMLAIAGSRENVPFPVIVEILFMEFAIELIREAGIRIPSQIGPTIGIVGALIIGQAAVQAGLVSPILVIVIAVTALASFTVPNYNLAFGIRVLRFAFLLGAALFGFYGLTLLFCAVLVRIAVQKSFGVPLLSPVAPSMDTSPDVLMRGPVFTMNERPSFLHTLKNWRQQPVTRPWSASTEKIARRKTGKDRRDDS
jgi:spore germination protein KA